MALKENSPTNVAIIESDLNQQKNKSLNVSLCQIASLEVYRGNESIIEINHSGFTLTDRNTIQVKLSTVNLIWHIDGDAHACCGNNS